MDFFFSPYDKRTQNVAQRLSDRYHYIIYYGYEYFSILVRNFVYRVTQNIVL